MLPKRVTSILLFLGLLPLGGCGGEEAEPGPEPVFHKPRLPEAVELTGLDLVASPLPASRAEVVELPYVAGTLTETIYPSVAFSRDGAKLYAYDDAGVEVFDVAALDPEDSATWVPITTWEWVDELSPEFGLPAGIRLSDDGRRIASNRGDNLVVVRDTKDGQVVSRFEVPQGEDVEEGGSRDVADVAISPDGSKVVANSHGEQKYYAWSPDDGSVLWSRSTPWRDAAPASFSNDGEHVLLWDENSVVLVDATGEVEKTIDVALDSVDFLEFFPDGRRALLGRVVESFEDDGDLSRDGYYGVVDLESGELLWSAETELDFLQGAAITPDGNLVAVSGDPSGLGRRSSVEFRSAVDGAEKFRLEFDDAKPILFSPDGRYFAHGSTIFSMPE